MQLWKCKWYCSGFRALTPRSIFVFQVFSPSWRSGFLTWVPQGSIIFNISIIVMVAQFKHLVGHCRSIMFISTCTLWQTHGKRCAFSAPCKNSGSVSTLYWSICNPFTEQSVTLFAFCQKFRLVSHQMTATSYSFFPSQVTMEMTCIAIV